MSLRDAIMEATQEPVYRPTCSVHVLLGKLDDDDRDALTEALADEHMPATSIARALRREGHDIGAHSLSRHRRGGCNCGRRP